MVYGFPPVLGVLRATRSRLLIMDTEETQAPSELNYGPQRIDDILKSWGLENHDLVEASPEQLTHKQVQKARAGRKLTLKLMQKVSRALNVAIWYRLPAEEREQYYEYIHRDLFSYAKGYDPDWVDPNQAIVQRVLG